MDPVAFATSETGAAMLVEAIRSGPTAIVALVLWWRVDAHLIRIQAAMEQLSASIARVTARQEPTP